MLKPRPIFSSKYSTFQVHVHSTLVYCIYKWWPLLKIRNNFPLLSKVCLITRGAEFLEEIQYLNAAEHTMNTASQAYSPGRYFFCKAALPWLNWEKMTWASRSGSSGSLQSPIVIPQWHWLQPGSAGEMQMIIPFNNQWHIRNKKYRRMVLIAWFTDCILGEQAYLQFQYVCTFMFANLLIANVRKLAIRN